MLLVHTVHTILAAVPDGAATQPGGTGKATTAVGYVKWVVEALLFVAALVAAAALAWEAHQGRGGGTAAHRLAGVIGGCLLVGAAAPVVNALVA